MVYSLSAAFFCVMLGALFSCLVPTFGGAFCVNFFSAPLVMCIYNAPLSIVLWTAFGCGLIQDCVHLSFRLGLVALSFVLAARLLYPVRLYFFKDALSTLPLMTFLFSSLSQAIDWLSSLFFDYGMPDRLMMAMLVEPLYDALFALIIFVLFPFFFSSYRKMLRKRKA